MTPRTILHIGQQKTGSTSLQQALVHDRRRLSGVGVLYPDAGHARGLGGELRPSHNGLFFLLQGNQGRQLWQSLEEVADALQRQIDEENPRVLVISAEHAFMAADQRADVLGGLDQILPGPKEVVVYLRRPDRYLSSHHKQLVQLGSRHLAPLHEPARLDWLRTTCQLDHRRALSAYADRYGSIRVFDYEQAGDSVDHFYRHVLQLDPPSRSARANPSIPSVLTNLALDHVLRNGRMRPRQISALVAHGEREPVDLLGPANRQRLPGLYADHNAYVGRLVGRTAFFEDLEAMAEPPVGSIPVEEADERYRRVFAELVSGPSVERLRSDCLLLEAAGYPEAAAALYSVHHGDLDPQQRRWFEADLEAASGGRATVRDGRYVSPALRPSARAGRGLRRTARAAVTTARRVRRGLAARRPVHR